MREDEFRAWMAARGDAASSVSTRISDSRKVERYFGDLDEAFDQDRCQEILARMAYSSADQAAGKPNPTEVTMEGNVYQGLSTMRSALNTYVRFRAGEAKGSTSPLTREAVLAEIARYDSFPSLDAYLADFNDLGSPHSYWLLHGGKRYPSKALVHGALGLKDRVHGGTPCRKMLSNLGFYVLNANEWKALRASFLERMAPFTNFGEETGPYWEIERSYKNGIVAEVQSLAASELDDVSTGQAILKKLTLGKGGLPLNWMALDTINKAAPEIRDPAFAAIGELARSDGDPEDAMLAAAKTLEAARSAGVDKFTIGNVLGMVVSVYGTVHPDRASWFKITKIRDAGKRLFDRDLFARPEVSSADIAAYVELMRAVFTLLEQEQDWQPKDLFDVQGFLWVALCTPKEWGDEGADKAEIEEEPEGDFVNASDQGPYWFLGAAFGRTDDQMDRFLSEGIWVIDSPSDRHRAQVLTMQPGQRVAIKSTYTRKQGLPFDNYGRVVSVMAIKATGTITANPDTGDRVEVKWDPPFAPREWYFYTYQPTIWEVYPDKEMARRLIAFAFQGEGQDHDWFKANLKNWQVETPAIEDDEPTPSQRIYDPQNIILYGPPGTGKTWRTMGEAVRLCLQLDETDELLTDFERRPELRASYDELKANGQIGFVTFHQNFTYEDFVEGLRPEPLDGGGFTLRPRSGVFRELAEAARKSAEEHVLIIDEINRANISKVFGELITLLEKDKRQGMSERLSLTLPYSGERFSVPANLHIVGTMNTADRSIALLDTALRRRFVFREIAPEPGLLGTVDGVDLRAVLTVINDRIEYLIDREHRIGHAFFIDCKHRAAIDAAMRDKVIPLLQEYFFEDWSRIHAVVGSGFIGSRKLSCPLGEGEDRESWFVCQEFAADAYDRLLGKVNDLKAAEAEDLDAQP